jgi:uncharacterized protein YyaL (SSP411 family)
VSLLIFFFNYNVYNTRAMKINRLSKETSTYLKKHVGNPVGQFLWCKVALDKARLKNKPILLPIGYLACHWPYVMTHESFKDEDTSKIMNEYFNSIKVDKEEGSDLDKIYQISQILLNKRTVNLDKFLPRVYAL